MKEVYGRLAKRTESVEISLAISTSESKATEANKKQQNPPRKLTLSFANPLRKHTICDKHKKSHS